jgi:hypothetical protein
MELLIVLATNIQTLTDITHITNDQRSHSILSESAYHFASLLALNQHVSGF